MILPASPPTSGGRGAHIGPGSLLHASAARALAARRIVTTAALGASRVRRHGVTLSASAASGVTHDVLERVVAEMPYPESEVYDVLE